MGEEHFQRYEVQRAPATVALSCSTCGRLITPCLVCAHPISCCGSSTWQDCSKCKLRNPTREHERHVLGLPPPFALSSSMARRVLVAHVGWRAYAVATHVQYSQWQEALDTSKFCNHYPSRTVDANKDALLSPSNDTEAPAVHLPFVLCEGILRSSHQIWKGEPHLDSCDNVPVAQCCQSFPMCKSYPCQAFATKDDSSRTNTYLDEKGSVCIRNTKGSIINGLEAMADGIMRPFDAMNCQEKEENMESVQGNSNSVELPLLATSNQGYRRCNACSAACKASCQIQLQIDKAGLYRCWEQLLALHCPGALSADLCYSSRYPICRSTIASVLKTTGYRTCVSQVDSSCDSRHFDHLSLAALQLGNSFLRPYLETWLTDKKVQTGGSAQFLEDVITTADHFIQKREILLELQSSISKACVTKKQAIQDCIALSQVQLLTSVSSFLKNSTVENIQERTDRWNKVVEPFIGFLDQINLLLEFCYFHVCVITSSQPASLLCTVNSQGMGTAAEVLSQKNTLAEAVSMVVSSWLLLYHDVAHATGIL